MPTPVDAVFGKLTGFAKPMMAEMRRTVLSAGPGLTEAIKWGTPCYSGNGIVCGLAAFKAHISITFWRGAELKDGGLKDEFECHS